MALFKKSVPARKAQEPQPSGRPDRQIQLMCTRGPVLGKIVKGMDLTLGTDAGCSMVLPEGSEGIRPEHCRVNLTEGRITLTDLGSDNGTRLRDGTALKPNEPVMLHNGDEFAIGSGIHFAVNLL